MSEAHLIAIADTQIPHDARREADTSAKGKSKATPKPSAVSGARSSPSASSVILEKQLLHQSRLHRNHLGEKDKTKERGVNRTHTVAAIGTTRAKLWKMELAIISLDLCIGPGDDDGSSNQRS